MAATKLLKPQECANVSKISNQSEAASVRKLELDELEVVSGGDSKALDAPNESITFEYGALQVQYVR